MAIVSYVTKELLTLGELSEELGVPPDHISEWNAVKIRKFIQTEGVWSFEFIPAGTFILYDAAYGEWKSFNIEETDEESVQDELLFKEQTIQEDRVVLGKSGFSVYVFGKGQDVTREDLAGSKAYDWSAYTSLVVDEALDRGARTAVIEMPWDPNPFDTKLYDAHRYGNKVIIAYKSQVLMTGYLVAPKVSNQGGRYISWTIQSTTFVIINSHFCPTSGSKNWADILPYDAIVQLARRHKFGVGFDREASERMKQPYEDDEGLEQMAIDISTTTPFKFIQKLCNEAGVHISCDAHSRLILTKIKTSNQNSIGSFIEGRADAEFEVTYNYGELAKTYTVFDQMRDSGAASAVEIEEFPLPIFKNLKRDGSFGKGEDQAILESGKWLSKAMLLKIKTPNLTDKNGKIWQSGKMIDVQSITYGIFVRGNKKVRSVQMVIRRVKITRDGDESYAEIWPVFRGVYDKNWPKALPFVLEPDSGLTMKTLDLGEG